jgi:hypothetical protein
MEQGRDRSRFETAQHNDLPNYIAPTPTPIIRTKRVMYRDSPQVSEEDVPPRTSSKRSTPLHRISVEEKGSQDTSRFSANKDSTPIERKGAIRKKHPEKGKLQKTPRHSVAVEWPESAARSDISTDKRDSQTTQLEFPSEKEALDTALKAHFDELRELDSAEQSKHSPLDANDKQKLQMATIGLESGIAHHPMSGPHADEYTISGSHKKASIYDTSTANSASTTPRQFYAPMRVPSTIAGENNWKRSQSPESHVAT